MKAETARLLRAVLRLIEDDVREWKDAVVEIDDREAAHYRSTSFAVSELERRMASIDNMRPDGSHISPASSSNGPGGSYSRKVSS